MTTEEKSPLFNRTYLKLMPVLLGIVILWLSLSNRSEQAPKIDTLIEGQVYQYIDDAITQPMLYLTYAAAPGLSFQQQEHRHALNTALTQTLSNYPSLSASWFEDRVTLNIPTVALSSQSVSGLIDNLVADILTVYPDAAKRASAELYLSRNERETQAVLNLTQQIAGFMPIPSIQQVFSQPPLALLTLADKDKKLSSTIAQQIADLPNQSLKTTTQELHTPSSINIKHRSIGYLFMMGQILPANTNDLTDTLASHLLANQLVNLTHGTETAFHLIHQPLAPTGYRALLLSKDNPFSNGFEQRLKASVTSALTEDQLDDTRTLLVQQYREQLEVMNSRISLILQQHFYQRPIASVSEFRDTLNDITLAQVTDRISKWLNPEQSLTLLIEPQ